MHGNSTTELLQNSDRNKLNRYALPQPNRSTKAFDELEYSCVRLLFAMAGMAGSSRAGHSYKDIQIDGGTNILGDYYASTPSLSLSLAP